MRDAASDALEVVNDLLAYEKIDAGMFSIQTETTSLLRFLKQCMQKHFIPALTKEITLTPPSLLCGDVIADIDAVKMAVVMKNLLSNAIKFTKKGGAVGVEVTTSCVEGEEKVGTYIYIFI
jgi:signal transduction histidine kinase